MTDLKSKSILIIDNGLLFSFARRMAREDGFGTVWYCNREGARGRPSFNESAVGNGFDGITLVRSEKETIDGRAVIDRADVVAYPDCFYGDDQMYWRSQGKAVWGSGRGSELELYRYFAKQVLKTVGLSVGPYVLLKGMAALRDYLKKNGDRVIKVSYVRGLMETRKHDKYWLSKTFLDGLEYRLGPLAETQEFIVEEKIETELEIGGDHLFLGRFPSLAINGCEVKDTAYVGIVQNYDELPAEILEVNEALEPILKRMGVWNFFSHEDRIAKDGTVYPIDLTMRMPSPAGEAQLEIWDNLPQVVYHGAHGEFVEPEASHSFVAQAVIYNKGDESEWIGVGIPQELRESVYLYYAMRRGEEDYVVPQTNPMDAMGSIVAKGNTMEEAVELCKKNAEKLYGHICIKTDELDQAVKEFELMQKKGMNIEAA